METHDVEALVAVVESGSIVAAAARLHLTQPGVSRRVQSLEQTLGAVLLDRQSRPLRPTPAGREAYEWGRRLLRSVEDMTARLASDGEPAGEFRVGVAPVLSELALGAPVDRIRAAYPRLLLRISAAWSGTLVADVRSARLDAAAVSAADNADPTEDLARTLLGGERVFVVAPAGLALAARPSLDALAEHAWVLNPEGCGFRQLVRRTLEAGRLPFEVAGEALGPEQQLSLVARGLGLGLVTASTLAASPFRRSVRTVDVHGFRPRVQFWLVHRAALGRLEKPVELLRDALMAELHRLRPRAKRRPRR
jgi:DNA-binding transcriptional LysR family regulator